MDHPPAAVPASSDHGTDEPAVSATGDPVVHDRVDVRLLDDAEHFHAEAGPWLARDPIGTNVVATVLASVATGGAAPGATWVLARSAAGEVVGAAMHTPPYALYLPPVPDAAAAAIARALHARGDVLPGVTGDVHSTAEFVRHWNTLTGGTATLETSEGVHVLGRLVPPSGVTGEARPARVDEVDLVAGWLAAFHVEAHGRPAPSTDPDGLLRRITGGRFVLWEDGGRPVSLAGWHTPAAGTGRVGPVHTPPECRRRGYAAAVTTAATQAVLAAGADRVMLFTDLANPTSNGVYARLGYRLVRNTSEWRFSPTPLPTTRDHALLP